MTPITNLGRLIADLWEQELRETPDPFNNCTFLSEMLGGPRLSYRERLDRQRVNSYGELIPRIVTVRRNLREMKGYRDKWPTPKLPL